MVNFRNRELEFIEECIAFSMFDLHDVTGKYIIENTNVFIDKFNSLSEYIKFVQDHVTTVNAEARIRNIFDLIKQNSSTPPAARLGEIEAKYVLFKNLLAENWSTDLTIPEKVQIAEWAKLGRNCYELCTELAHRLVTE